MMGNKKRPNKEWHNTSPTTVIDPKEGAGGVLVEELPPPTWRATLEDLTAAAAQLRSETAVRGERAEPRVRVYAGGDLIGYVPASISTAIQTAMKRDGGTLLGRVVSIDRRSRRVDVELRLEGR